MALGGHQWVLTQARGVVTDGIHVLSGLDFGWTAPAGLFVRQPDATTASFSVTVPDFAALEADISSQVAIEVRADEDGPVIARFYGDVTDLRARTRSGRTGVTLSVIAVGYTVRLAELAPVLPYIVGEPGAEGGILEKDSARAIWANCYLAGDPASVWSSPDRQMGQIFSSVDARQQVVGPLDWLTALLDQAVNAVDLTEASRMILAPVVDRDVYFGSDVMSAATLLYTSGQPTYTLDTVVVGELAATPDYYVPGNMIRRDLSWSTNKRTAPDQVDVSGTPTDLDFDLPDINFGGTVSAGMYGSGSGAHEVLTGHFRTEAEAQATADFYASHNLPKWQLDPITLAVSRGIDEEAFTAADVPAGLFPDWTLPEGDPARGGCYARSIGLLDVPADQLPFALSAPDSAVHGWLTGARCRIAGGALELDLTIRQQAT